jgi:tetratricopeptide (TPR) repeat protein
MRRTVLALLLLVAPAVLAAPPAAAGGPAAAVTDLPPGPPAPLPGPPPPAAAGRVPAPPTPAAPTRALIEKLGAGDRAYLSGDHRTALFAYLDAVYLDPTSAAARIRLARAYAALGHRDQAERQLQQALELDAGNSDALKVRDELASPAAPGAPVPVITSTVPAPSPVAPPAPPAPRVYRITDDGGDPKPAPPRVGAPPPVDPAEASRHAP